ncbi:NKG2-A/NKG2-B type II integral membrane protein-like isoform X2 [Crassostrea angulata]|nr:NKG2-A/NKG2-B type II integral membrane protein-like isoform X2 [Crassostrea angulata]
MNYFSGYGLPRFSKDLTSEFQLKPESTDRFVQVTRTSGRWRDLVDPNNDSNNTYIYKGSQSTELDGKQKNSKIKLYVAILILFTFLIVSCIGVAVVSTMLYHEQNKHNNDALTTKSITMTTINPTLHCKDDTPAAEKCSEGWTLNDGSCYWLNKDFLSWDEAQAACRKRSATLVEITNGNENMFLEEFAINYLIWVGIKVIESNTRINTCSQTPSSVGLTYTREFGKCIESITIFDGTGEPFSFFVNRDCNDRLMSVCERFF